MGRNIKFYNGHYTAQTTNQWDATSTGYTVPAGKIARLGFDCSIKSGYQNYANVCGFYAGTNGTGSTSTGHNTNRMLMVYMPQGDFGGGTTSEVYASVHFNPDHGHRWTRVDNINHTPQLYIGDSVRERYTTRNSGNDWADFNFGYAFSTGYYGTLAIGRRYNTSARAQKYIAPPGYDGSRLTNGYDRSIHSILPTPHATAGETVYLYDWAGSTNYNNWSNRAAGHIQWSMLVIEEDA